MIWNIATVRRLDNLIKKTTLIVRLTLSYDIKMDLNEIKCNVTDRIHTADDRIWGTRYWVICWETSDLLKSLSRYLLLKRDHYFFPTRLIIHNFHVFLRYSGSLRILPFAVLDILAILRTFVCIRFRLKHCCNVIYSAEISSFYSYFFKHWKMYQVKIIILFKLSVLLCQHNFHIDGLARMGIYVVYMDILKPK
jgi:hypothetical protein